MRRPNIRWRLTLWFGAVLAAVLLIFSASVYLLMIQLLQSRTDRGLEAQMAVIEDQIHRAPSPEVLRERLTWQFAIHPVYEMQITENGDTTWLRSERIVDAGLPMTREPIKRDKAAFENAEVVGVGSCRMLSKPIATPYASLLVQVALSLEMNEKNLGQLREVLLFTGPPLVLCALGCGYLLARKALAPVERLAVEADQITATRLDLRLDAPNPDDELGRLTRTLNGMIGRLERSFGEIQRFSADAAHELRTPLAALRSEAEVTLRMDREPAEYRRALESMLEEIEHMTRMTEKLLFLCREDSGAGPAFESLRLDAIVRGVVDHARASVEAAGHELVLVDSPTSCVVHGDRDQLRRLLFNLIDNAVKYTPPGGTIQVALECHNGRAELSVEDNGVGIAPEHLPNLFNRFYRVDSARPRQSSATGLGLAISLSIAKAHQGALDVASQPDQGTRFTFSLPATSMELQRRTPAQPPLI